MEELPLWLYHPPSVAMYNQVILTVHNNLQSRRWQLKWSGLCEGWKAAAHCKKNNKESHFMCLTMMRVVPENESTGHSQQCYPLKGWIFTTLRRIIPQFLIRDYFIFNNQNTLTISCSWTPYHMNWIFRYYCICPKPDLLYIGCLFFPALSSPTFTFSLIFLIAS